MKGSKLQRLGVAFVLFGILSVSPGYYGPDYTLIAMLGVLLAVVGLFVSEGDSGFDGSEDARPARHYGGRGGVESGGGSGTNRFGESDGTAGDDEDESSPGHVTPSSEFAWH